jgi:MYXO-CTERM domain-containing protein
MAVVSVGLAGSAAAAILENDHFTLQQTYSVAPNFQFGNPAWDVYVENMRASAAAGFTGSAGDPNLPSYFAIAPEDIPLSHAVVTDATGPGLYVATGARKFNSWRGQADPGTVFGPEFADQYGSHVFAPYVIVAKNDIPITLTSVVRDAYSTAQNGGATPYVTFTYSDFTNTRIGVTSFGLDGVLGGGDDTYIDDGSAIGSTPILAFIATGSGVAFQMSQQYDGTAWLGPVVMDDSEIFAAYSEQWPGGFAWDLRVEYTVNFSVANIPDSVTLVGGTVQAVPEPTSLGLAGVLGLAGLTLFRRRRK